MFRKFLVGFAPVLAVAALVAMPAVSQAAPQFFMNGKKAGTKHEPGFSLSSHGEFTGAIKLTNGVLPPLACRTFLSQQLWNQVKEGTERGFEETVGYTTWECKSGLPCEVTNERGVKKEGIFLSAEGPPDLVTEKARHNGNTSLPWNEELTEKEPVAGTTASFVLTHHVKIWYVIPLGTEMGGEGVGPACGPLGGQEIPFEDREGASEKARGEEVGPKYVNGVKNGLQPSLGILEGEKTEKNGAVETGSLESRFGPGYLKGELTSAGATDFELLTFNSSRGWRPALSGMGHRPVLAVGPLGAHRWCLR